jgi:branched-chain amino acid transport system ATP-binding protein
LARALAAKPKLLLADELSPGLAPQIVTRLLEAVRDAARKRSVGVLIVEQHVQQALRYAERVYVMRRGAIVLSGTVDEIRPHLQEAYL